MPDNDIDNILESFKDPSLSTLNLKDFEINEQDAEAIVKAFEQNTRLIVNIDGSKVSEKITNELKKINQRNTSWATFLTYIDDEEKHADISLDMIENSMRMLDIAVSESDIEKCYKLVQFYDKNHKFITQDESVGRTLDTESAELNIEQLGYWSTLNKPKRNSLEYIFFADDELIEKYKESLIRAYLKLDNVILADQKHRAIFSALIKNARGWESVLSLDDAQVKDNSALFILECLKESKITASLDLSKNQISNNGAKALASILESNDVLVLLNLSENDIDDDGARALANMLENNTTLTHLFLDDDVISEEICNSIEQALQRNENLAFINKIIKKIAENEELLDFKSNLEKIISRLKTLRTPLEIERWYEAFNLLSENLNKKSDSSRHLKAQLEYLRGQFIVVLSKLANQASDNMRQRNLEIVAMIINDTALKQLQLNKNSINNEIYEEIIITHKRNQNSVFMCEILKQIDKKIHPEHLLPNFRLHTFIVNFINLLKVDLTKSEIESHYELVKYLTQDSEYPMDLNRLFDIEVYRQKVIRAYLKLDNKLTINEKNIEIPSVLIENCRLIEMELNDAQINDTNAELIVKSLNKIIASLELSKNQIGNCGAQAIAEILEHNSTLVLLDLRDNQIDDEGANAIANMLEKNTTLTALYLDKKNVSEGINERIEKALRRNKNLALIRSILKNADKGIELMGKKKFYLAKNKILSQVLDIGLKLDDEIKDAIDNLDAIQTQLEVKSYTQLVTLFTQDYKKLNSIGQNSVPLDYAKPLIEKFLILTIKNDSPIIKAEALQNVSKLIKYGNFLQLSLKNHKISDAGIVAIFAGFNNNSKITRFILSDNKISDPDVQIMFEMLKENSTLREFHLLGIKISDDAARTIAEMLKQNSTLTQFYLRGNEISDAGVNVIIEALKTNSTLTELDLSNNEISDAGVNDIIEALKTNRTLTRLDLSHNKITNDGAQAILQSLDVNVRLISLDIDFDESQNIDKAILADINDILKRNIKIAPIFAISNSIEKGDFQKVDAKAITEVIDILNAARTKQEITVCNNLFKRLHEKRNNLVNVSSEILETYRVSLVAGCLNLYEGDELHDKIIAILNMSSQDKKNESICHPLIALLMSNLDNQDKKMLIYVILPELYQASDNNLPNYKTILQNVSSSFPEVGNYLKKQIQEIEKQKREEKIKIQEQQEKIEREEYIEKYGKNRIISESLYSINSLKGKDLTNTASSLEDCLEYTHTEYARTGKIWPIVTIDEHRRAWNRFFYQKVENNTDLSDGQKSLLYVQHARYNQQFLKANGKSSSTQETKALNARQCNDLQNALLNDEELPDELSKANDLTHSMQNARSYFLRFFESRQLIKSRERNTDNNEFDKFYGKGGMFGL